MGQKIIFMLFDYDLTSLKFCEGFTFVLAVFTDKFLNNGYLNYMYVKKRVNE